MTHFLMTVFQVFIKLPLILQLPLYLEKSISDMTPWCVAKYISMKFLLLSLDLSLQAI